jgi:hypothetical protein
MRVNLLALSLASVAVSLPAAPAGALVPMVRAEFHSATSSAGAGYLIAITCDAVATAGAIATAVQCTLSSGETAYREMPGMTAVTTIMKMAEEGPIRACAVGTARFATGDVVTSAPYCRYVSPYEGKA